MSWLQASSGAKQQILVHSNNKL